MHDLTTILTFLLTVMGYLVTWSLVATVLLTERKQETSKVAWIMAIITMPYVGAVLYLIFGMNRVASRVESRLVAWRRLSRVMPELSERHLLAHDHLLPQQKTLARVATKVGQSQPTVNNRVLILHVAAKAFDEIEKAILEAKSSIHLEYYIWQPDGIGTRLRDLLITKARQGIEIRFLYDGIGSMRLSKKFLAPMVAAGIGVTSFVPGRGGWERFSLNLRNHRKIIIVDGEVGFTGGMNVGDEYLSLDPRHGHWVDTHLRLEGPTVLQLQQIFAEDWHYATGEEVVHEKYFPRPRELGQTDAQIVAGGPDMEESVFQTLFFTAINEARHHITLVTSYFVPTNALTEALKNAACRGVKTRLMLSGSGGYWYTYHAARASFDALLNAGVEIWEFEKGYLHSKTLTIDGIWSLVGSPNFDSRSVFLNFEVALAIYDRDHAHQLVEQFDTDISSAKKVDPEAWKQRPPWERVKENWCRLFAPVL